MRNRLSENRRVYESELIQMGREVANVLFQQIFWIIQRFNFTALIALSVSSLLFNRNTLFF